MYNIVSKLSLLEHNAKFQLIELGQCRTNDKILAVNYAAEDIMRLAVFQAYNVHSYLAQYA